MSKPKAKSDTEILLPLRNPKLGESGTGGFALIIVPSLDLVIYKMGGNNGQYDPTLMDVRSRSQVTRAMIGSRFKARRSLKAAALAMMEFGVCWKWFARR